MLAPQLRQALKSPGGHALIIRAAIVGVNFAVMFGLAAGLGLESFGRLAVTWGMALIASTCLSVGAPLLILRAMTDGGGLHPRVLIRQVVVYPLLLAAVAAPVSALFWTEIPWDQVFVAALLINLVHCLAAIMRALGSLQASMALRDAGPQVALGFGAVLTLADPLYGAAIVMAAGAVAAMLWIVEGLGRSNTIGRDYPDVPVDTALWSSTVLGMIQAQVDIVVGGAILSDSQIGFYALARRVINLIVLPVTVATWVSAPAISGAFGVGDLHLLREAARKNSLLALWPGLALAVAGTAMLPLLAWTLTWPQTATSLCLILLAGTIVQLWFSATQTVATLCHLAHFTALSRLATILFYLTLAFVLPTPGMLGNALAYVAGLTLGSLGLWLVVWRQLSVDTSALSLWGRGVGWSHS